MDAIATQALRMLDEEKTLKVRHRDGTPGVLNRADLKRSGYFFVRFADGVCAPHIAEALFFEGKNLASLLQSSEELGARLASLEEKLKDTKTDGVIGDYNAIENRSSDKGCWCTGSDGVLKASYASDVEALQAARGKPVRLRAYQCPDGNGWHLTKQHLKESAKSVNAARNVEGERVEGYSEKRAKEDAAKQRAKNLHNELHSATEGKKKTLDDPKRCYKCGNIAPLRQYLPSELGKSWGKCPACGMNFQSTDFGS